MRKTVIRIALLIFATFSATVFARSSKLPEITLQQRLAETVSPLDGEVCFSPDEHCDAKLIKFIQSAHQSLDLAIYDLNHEQLVHQILILAKKVRVRVLVDRRQAKETKSLVGVLAKAGVDVRFGHQRGIMHNKFIILDEHWVETGSYNFTNHATESNSENQVYLSTPKIVRRFHERFERIWRDGKTYISRRKDIHIKTYKAGL